ncbi:MAG: hypothetical protein U1F66_07800 [bacterium]
MEGKDPLIELNRRAMDFIWSQVNPKEVRDGKEYITYVKGDLPFLYYSGLVDTKRWSREDWDKAFEDCLGADGRYWVSYEKMIWLGRFRYCKVVGDPFDPLKMRTGKYTPERLWKIFENSIIPSCALPETFFKRVFDILVYQKKHIKDGVSKQLEALKEAGKGKEIEDQIKNAKEPKWVTEDGQEYLVIEREDLVRLKEVLDTYPSPRRKMELMVEETRSARLKQLADVALAPQKSTFEAGKDFRETTKQNLKEMLVKASESSDKARRPKDEVLDLKAMQKNRPTKF